MYLLNTYLCTTNTYYLDILNIYQKTLFFVIRYWINIESRVVFCPLHLHSIAYLHKWLLSFWPTYPIRTRWAKRCPRQKCPDLGYRCCPFRCALGLGLNRPGLGQNRAGWLGGWEAAQSWARTAKAIQAELLEQAAKQAALEYPH